MFSRPADPRTLHPTASAVVLAALLTFSVLISRGDGSRDASRPLLGTPTATWTMTATATATTTATATGTPTCTATHTASPTASATETRTSTPTSTRTPSPSATPTGTSTATSTSTRTPSPSSTRTPSPSSTATATVTTPAAPAEETSGNPAEAPARHAGVSRLVLAHYFAWYDGDGWDDCNISAGDRPLVPYSSDDPAAIARHVEMALSAGIDGFALHWFAPEERTDRNFAALLAQSEGRPFHSTVVFSRHIWHGSPAPAQENLIQALNWIMERYSGHPNFLRVLGRPVLFFTNPGRVPLGGAGTPQEAWAEIRRRVDPARQTWWIVEGLEASYLETFDGLYVFKVTHAAYPNDYVKASRWAARVREWETTLGQPRLWAATLSPGWDDLRAGCRPDVRSPSQPHRRNREEGAFYRATFEAALASDPDWLLITSFNEWVEGTYIEPSQRYGDLYLRLTAEFAARFHGK